MAGAGDVTREMHMFMGRLAEHAERFEDMAEHMEAIGLDAKAEELNVEERNMLSVALKSLIAPKRRAVRILSSIEQKEGRSGREVELEWCRKAKAKVIEEWSGQFERTLSLIDDHLLPSASDVQSKVFYLKMRADYHRYDADFQTGDERKNAADIALSAYKSAQELSVAELPANHPGRLGVALNFSVFYFEIVNSREEACKLAREAFDSAFDEMDTLDEDTYKDSHLIMQLLRDNLNHWSKEEKEDI
ncbi:hypothetical protein BSKO_09419 [Bryopsis sp. KO-2023]|nr:hypothetical protein BSKO_09419 [Bryopsis sp. KO-2023]